MGDTVTVMMGGGGHLWFRDESTGRVVFRQWQFIDGFRFEIRHYGLT